MDLFANYLIRIEKVSDVDVANFVSIFSKFTCKKNEILLNNNQICDKIYYVETGALRTFYIDEKGVERTSSISLENEFCSNWASFHNLSYNNEFIQSLENSSIFYATHSDFYEVVNSSFELHKIYSKILEKIHIHQIKRFDIISNNSVIKRLEYFEKCFPNLRFRITNKILASFLNTTPEHCSYLKSRILKSMSSVIIIQQKKIEIQESMIFLKYYEILNFF